MIDTRAIVVKAADEPTARERALEDAASVYQGLLVTGIETITHIAGDSWRATVGVRERLKPREGTPMTTPTKSTIGPRDDLDFQVWAAEDLGVDGASCSKCGGSGKEAPTIATLNRAINPLVGTKTPTGLSHLIRFTQDPPLSVVRRIAKVLDVSLDDAARWLGQVHKAASAATDAKVSTRKKGRNTPA